MRNCGLSGRSSVFQHCIRGNSIEQNDNGKNKNTNMKKIEMRKKKKEKKKEQLEKEQLEKEQLEKEQLELELEVKVNSSKEKRKSYYDDKSGNFYVVNKETGESSWEDDALNVTGNENSVEVKVLKD